MAILMAMATAGPAAADEIEERIPMAPGGRLVVELSTGAIEVETHDEAAVDIDASASGWSDYEFDLQYDEHEVRLEGRHRGWFPFGRGRVLVRVRVPEVFDVDVRTSGGRIDVQEIEGDVRARTSGGPIEVEDVIGDVDLETSGGSIRVQEVSGRASARTSGGGIHLSEVDGEIEARTSGGGIRLREVGAPVDARTSGGTMEVRFRAAPAGHIESSGGGIEVEWDPRFGAQVQAKTSGGRVTFDDDFDLAGDSSRSEADVTVGRGGARLDVQTSGGNIRIRAR